VQRSRQLVTSQYAYSGWCYLFCLAIGKRVRKSTGTGVDSAELYANTNGRGHPDFLPFAECYSCRFDGCRPKHYMVQCIRNSVSTFNSFGERSILLFITDRERLRQPSVITGD